MSDDLNTFAYDANVAGWDAQEVFFLNKKIAELGKSGTFKRFL